MPPSPRGPSKLVCSALLAGLFFAACAAPQKPVVLAPPAPPPLPPLVVPAGRLPTNAHPLAYTLELTIDPQAERFSGRTQIAILLDAPTELIWLHGRSLHVTSARAVVGSDAIDASYEQLNEDGVVALRFKKPVPAGNSLLELVYDAAFDHQLKGLYRVDAGGEAYAFTQFEPISARLAFPSFDEPGFKTPFDLWLTVPAKDAVASNTAIATTEAAGNDQKRVHFEQTKPLPTYLVAFAVGPLELVTAAAIAPDAQRAQPLPLRGIAVKGRGALLSHALNEAGPQITALERYFGSAYPYGKLDLVAVPDFAAGAMENAGLVTFRDWLLLVDPRHASEGQRRASSYVIAHELAHQWVGDLVTMRYWDDLWLNEAFATWIGYRVAHELHPEHRPELAFLNASLDAMEADSRTTARMIRQPIDSTHDISNAFDGITYNKGGAILAMFERYLGSETFQKGVQSYLATHAFANATTEDFLDAVSASAGRDVKTPFNTFLTQIGVPLVKASLRCDASHTPVAQLELEQSRSIPLGFRGTASGQWQIPVCARYETSGKLHESCTLLTEKSGVLPLEGKACPTWIMPNADAAGYYRFTLPPADFDKLRTSAWKKLSARERVFLAQALEVGFESGTLDGNYVFAALPSLVADDNRSVIERPMSLLRFARNEIVPEGQRAVVEARARTLYAPLHRRLGLRERAGEDGDTKLLRAEVADFLAETGRDAELRKQLVRLGTSYLGIGADNAIHETAVASDLADLAVRMVAEDGDAATFDALYKRFVTTDDVALRMRLLHALGSVRDARSERALALALDPALHVNEVLSPVRDQLADPRTRDAAWAWFEAHFADITTRLSSNGAGFTPWLATSFCDDAMAARAEAFFAPKIETLMGGPRSLAGAVEALQLCAAKVKAQRDSVIAAFAH